MRVMVNLDESLTTTEPYNYHQIHFDLSKPLVLKSSSILKLESNGRDLFEFLEPYEPAHLRDRSINGPDGGGLGRLNGHNSSNGGKMQSSYSVRNGLKSSAKPYELSRPQRPLSSSLSLSSQQIPPPLPPTTTAVSNSMVECSSLLETSGAHQSALLARLTSLSSTFKSIFVRPKASRTVSYDKFGGNGNGNGGGGGVTNTDKSGSGSTEFKLKLFSVSNEIIGSLDILFSFH